MGINSRKLAAKRVEIKRFGRDEARCAFINENTRVMSGQKLLSLKIVMLPMYAQDSTNQVLPDINAFIPLNVGLTGFFDLRAR